MTELKNAMDSVDRKTDRAIRNNAARAILREAVSKCVSIVAGVQTLGVEEIEFTDALENAFGNYMRAKADANGGRAYIGSTAGMEEIVKRANDMQQKDKANG